LRTASGARVPVKVVHRHLSFGDEVYAIHDLTERRAAEKELQRRNKVLREREEELHSRNLMLDTALRHMSQGLCMYDKDERIVICNERYATVYGLSPDAVKAGMTRAEIVEMRIARGLWAGSTAEDYRRQRAVPITSVGHSMQELSDGRTISLVHVPMPGGGWVCTHEDVTERRQAKERIEHLALHDGLTDLPNRVLLREQLQQALARLRPRELLAVHCLNLDRFKEVNDAIGHAIGDELLQDFAARLRHVADGIGMVARTGGDEFVIVQNPASSPADVTDLAAAVIAKMTEPFVLGEHMQVVIGTSIGIAMAPADGTEADQLLKNANLALYRAKQEERGKYRFFEKEMDARMRARHELECNLRSALANGELDLYYQPLLNLKRNEISCFEALLRWRTADGEMIPPGEFVPLAEETGLIVPMGEWALRHAVAEAAKWPRQIRLAVNLSPVQFNSRNLVQIVMSALAASGLEASRLELEITESLLLQDRETTLATLHQLRDLGVRISMDDFGTGFSSLNYLRSFPFDKLKVDRCFIAGLAEGNEESLAIVRAVAQLGASLGIATTAEGVETQAQLEVARREGFTEVQGFWLAEPRSAAEIAEAYDLYRRTTKPRRPHAAKVVEPPAEKAVEGPGRPRRPRRMKQIRSG
jgi:diguanylate cyclase (GGDEF)-like protein